MRSILLALLIAASGALAGATADRTVAVRGANGTIQPAQSADAVLFPFGTTWVGATTVGQPSVSAANNGAIYYDKTLQTFMASTNTGAFAPFGGGLSGLTAGRVTVASSSTTIGDFAALVFGTAHGLSVNRAIGVPTTTNEMVGFDAGNATMTGTFNTLVGNSAGTQITSGSNNSFVGYQAGNGITSGAQNTAFGSGSLPVLATANDNTALGYGTLNADTGGRRNTAVGSVSLNLLVTGVDNVGVGYNALNKMDQSGFGGSEMTAVGSGAMANSDFTSLRDVAVGFNALTASGHPADNVAVGWKAATANATGLRVTALGSNTLGSLGAIAGGNDNIAIGANAGGTITSGAGNILIGTSAGDSTSATANGHLVIGSNATTGFISGAWIGNGETNATPQAITVNATGGSGADVAGAALTLAGGISTGAGAGGAVVISTSPATASSSTPNALTTRLTVGGDGGAQWTGITTANQPALSGANNGTVFYDRTLQALRMSLNGAAYVTIGSGSGTITGSLTATRVPFASSATALTDSAQMTFSTAAGLTLNRSGTTNTEFFGSGAGNTTQSGIDNTALGSLTLSGLTSGSENTAFGQQAAASVTTGTNGTYIGSGAGKSQLATSDSTAVGFAALKGNGTPANNTGIQLTAVGSNALASNTSGSRGTALGYNAATLATTSSDNTTLGSSAGAALTTGGTNTFVGSSAGAGWQTIGSQTAVGYQALQGGGALSGTFNTAVGYQASKAITTAIDNTSLGYQALLVATTSGDNTAIGFQAGVAILGGSGNNTLVGSLAGSKITSGNGNTVVGQFALPNSTTANENTALGKSALQNNTASDNTALGFSSGNAIQTGSQNTLVGAYSGTTLTGGADNVIIGFNAGSNAVNSTANTTIIGSDSSPQTNVYFGKGNLSATATTYAIRGTDGLGTDKVGGALVLDGGRGTGTGAPGTVTIATAVAAGSSATLQTLTTGLTVTATAAPDIQANAGNMVVSTVGKGLTVKEGSGAKMGVVDLIGGTATVTNGNVTTSSRILLTSQADGGTVGFLRVSARTASTSFVITSSSALDTSTVAWFIVEPTP